MTLQLRKSAEIFFISIKIGTPNGSLAIVVNPIYWPPPLHGVWIDEQGCCDQKQELARQQKHTEDWLGESNPEILEIIPLNTKYDDHFSQKGNQISGG